MLREAKRLSIAGVHEIYVASNSQGTNGTIFALHAEDGSILWQHETGEPIVGGSMALAKDVLRAGGGGQRPQLQL